MPSYRWYMHLWRGSIPNFGSNWNTLHAAVMAIDRHTQRIMRRKKREEQKLDTILITIESRVESATFSIWSRTTVCRAADMARGMGKTNTYLLSENWHTKRNISSWSLIMKLVTTYAATGGCWGSCHSFALNFLCFFLLVIICVYCVVATAICMHCTFFSSHSSLTVAEQHATDMPNSKWRSTLYWWSLLFNENEPKLQKQNEQWPTSHKWVLV